MLKNLIVRKEVYLVGDISCIKSLETVIKRSFFEFGYDNIALSYDIALISIDTNTI